MMITSPPVSDYANAPASQSALLTGEVPVVVGKEMAILTLEGLALQNGLMPITLLRESCPPEAEKLLRKLGRVPHTADPWLPVAIVGPLIVMAHHNPRASDLWGVPLAFTVRVLISSEQYQKPRTFVCSTES